ncbi:MAG TPA: hypothetical protein VJ201_03915 [Candidatus Babeliales bacterium]|nr:hypothetical protein [Candidatus Babeliales bacterium]
MKNCLSLLSLIFILSIGRGLYADEGLDPVTEPVTEPVIEPVVIKYKTDRLFECAKGSKKVTVCLGGSEDVVQCKKGRGKSCNIETGEKLKLKKGDKAPDGAGTCAKRYYCAQELEK